MKKKPTPHTVTGCNFVGVQYDAKAVNAIEMIATGVIENAKALNENAKTLGALAHVLKASNVEIQAMLRMDAS